MCGPKGRDCIEKNSSKSFNCSTTCGGIYADVQWVGTKLEVKEDDEEENPVFTGKDEELKKLYKHIADLKKEIVLIKSNGQEMGEVLDKEKYKMLIAEYRKLKRMNVKHIKFNSAENSVFGSFGKSKFGKTSFKSISGPDVSCVIMIIIR